MLEGDFFEASGVILHREMSGEKKMWLKLFLKKFGIINVNSRRSLGDSEPLTWGKFSLAKKRKSVNYYIDDIEIADDMLSLRNRRDSLFTALKWTQITLKFLTPEQPDNDLLANLYWSMNLLKDSRVPADAANWKFLWHWLENWGIAPDIVNFYTLQNFNHDEIILLTQISLLNARGIINLFSNKISPKIRENSFKIAAELAEKFLIEK